MNKTLVIVRGLPGSGKTTLARVLKDYGDEYAAHYEADQFMVNNNGLYEFNPSKLRYCHEMCLTGVEEAMVIGVPMVIVSNTFTQYWEMEKYIHCAKHYKYNIQLIECSGNFGSIHNVPAETIEKMKNRWSPNAYVMEEINKE